MTLNYQIRLRRCLLALSIFVVVPSGLLCSRALGAGAFDGTYVGTVVVSAGSKPNCGWHLSSVPGSATDTITITNNHFDHLIHDAPTSVDVGPDGRFDATGMLRTGYAPAAQHIVGKVEGGGLRAHVKGTGGACEFDLSLQKQ